MRKLAIYKLIVASIILIQSCTISSTEQIKKVDKPNESKSKDFGIEVTGQIIYQYYQKYGFTDLEEQLILILKPDNVDKLKKKLPISSVDNKRINKIDLRKFRVDSVLNFDPEKRIMADIRLEATEFVSGENQSMFYSKGKYKLTINDSVETIYVFDKQTGLLYIESKKMK